jgi:GNAT superfamily N-acetyltransferase
MTPTFQRFTKDDLGVLLDLMRQLYEHGEMPWSERTAEVSLSELLRSPEKGGAWLVRVNRETTGYLVLTLAFSLEFGGSFGFLDELYIRPEWRGKGVGSAALRFAEVQCLQLGASALRLETATDNRDGVRFYERHGLTREPRYLMTKRLG